MIKQVQTTDLERLTALGAEFFAESQLPGTFNPEHWVQMWTSLLVNAGAEIWIYEDVENSEVVGAIGMVIAPCLNTGDLVATESFWFVSKAHRRLVGLELFHKMVERAQARGCKRATMGAILHSPTFLSVNRFFTNTLEMRPLETTYVLHL